MGDERTTIFISHASPGDNPFATWLAARLSMAGYDVWCDQQKLLGGEDFWADIETVLRTRTVKFVLIISAKLRDTNGQLRDGVAKEIALANTLKKKLPDAYFVIPALIDDTPSTSSASSSSVLMGSISERIGPPVCRVRWRFWSAIPSRTLQVSQRRLSEACRKRSIRRVSRPVGDA